MQLNVAKKEQAFGLIDAMFAMAIAGVLFMALYSGLSFGFKTIKFARENTRATQIMVEKMETIRLYTWTQIVSNGFIPTNKFAVPYYSVGATNSSLMYTGQIVISPLDMATSYSNDMKKISINVSWLTGKTPRSRTMTTYVSKGGMQSYVYY